jgi:hypothetical protein
MLGTKKLFHTTLARCLPQGLENSFPENKRVQCGINGFGLSPRVKDRPHPAELFLVQIVVFSFAIRLHRSSFYKQFLFYAYRVGVQARRKWGGIGHERALVMELLQRYSGLKQRMIAERFGGLK